MSSADVKYTKDHEWIKLTGGEAEVGITDYAQDALGDVVYVQVPAVGTAVQAGESMGEGAEKMARTWGVGREEQDRYALKSHRKAVEAWEKGVYEHEVMTFPVPPAYRTVVERDTIPRADTIMPHFL